MQKLPKTPHSAVADVGSRTSCTVGAYSLNPTELVFTMTLSTVAQEALPGLERGLVHDFRGHCR